MENICFELRYLPDTRRLARDHALLLLCDLSQSSPDAVEVAIVSESFIGVFISANCPCDLCPENSDPCLSPSSQPT